LFDPKGETAKWLKNGNVRFDQIGASANLGGFEMLIVGKGALTLSNAAPNISRVVEGLKVLIFEQTGDVLEKRFGFRTEEYGLRNVFPRAANHPILDGLSEENLRDWRGEATLLAPKLDYEMRPRYGPTIQWCDMPVTRLWRCGNRGNVASALIEKPPRPNFAPIVDGGYALQYTPLLECREGSGLIIFCQLDVTGRTESDPAAERIANNLVDYVSNWRPTASRSTVYLGPEEGKRFLESIGVLAGSLSDKGPPTNELMVIAAGAAIDQKAKEHISQSLKRGGAVVTIGLNETEANQLLPVQISTREGEHISTYFDGSTLGVSCADAHNRDPRKIPLVTGGVTVFGDGVLARATNAPVLFCQITPWDFEGEQQNLRRTKRHVAVLFSRLLGNFGAASSTPIAQRFSAPVVKGEQRWRDGLYVDQPQEWDDPYRFFRW
jgi:hypothetical protein